MKRLSIFFVLIPVLLLSTSCATVFGRKNRKVTVHSNQTQELVINNRKDSIDVGRPSIYEAEKQEKYLDIKVKQSSGDTARFRVKRFVHPMFIANIFGLGLTGFLIDAVSDRPIMVFPKELTVLTTSEGKTALVPYFARSINKPIIKWSVLSVLNPQLSAYELSYERPINTHISLSFSGSILQPRFVGGERVQEEGSFQNWGFGGALRYYLQGYQFGFYVGMGFQYKHLEFTSSRPYYADIPELSDPMDFDRIRTQHHAHILFGVQYWRRNFGIDMYAGIGEKLVHISGQRQQFKHAQSSGFWLNTPQRITNEPGTHRGISIPLNIRLSYRFD